MTLTWENKLFDLDHCYEIIRQSETYGMKGVAKTETIQELFDEAVIRELIMKGRIWSPRPGFLKILVGAEQ